LDPDATRDLTPLQPQQSTAAARDLPSVSGYEILQEVDTGGMGVVYRARHLRFDLPVALKMIRMGAHASAHDLARFHREARAVAALNHPGVVRIYDYGEHNGLPYFSMEWAEGGSLADRLRGGAIQPEEAARLVETLARSMHYVHECGIIHRDLKPANVLLTADGVTRIADFGLARRLGDDPGLTITGMVMGTASYMAPEQAEGKKEVGRGADVYGLGAILYEALTGRPPFRAPTRELTILQVLADEPEPPSQLRKEVPRELEAVCLKCLEKNPARRYHSAEELADDLRRFLVGEPVSVGTATILDWHERWARGVGYEVLDLVACGRTGFLYKARQLSLNRLVALKLLPFRSHDNPAAVAHFRREAEAIARLHHPNIVQIYDFGERGGQPYFTMEFVEGSSVAEQYPDTPMAPRKAAALVATLARTMHYAHQRGVIHCALKPGSVLLSPTGTLKVSNFGLARLLGEAEVEAKRGADDRRLASYMAPELVEGRSLAAGPGADVYALGALLFKLLTGQPPFLGDTLQATREQVLHQEAPSPGHLQPGIPPDLEAICLRCLRKDPTQRYLSAQDLAERLDGLRASVGEGEG
jgi:serine/threonine protein kinase